MQPLPPQAIKPFVDVVTRVRVETSSRLSVATETFSIEAMVRGYHVYQDSWDADIGEQLPPCKREPGNRFAVAAGGETVSLVPKISSVCSSFCCVVVQFSVE